MTALTGTVVDAGRTGERGTQFIAKGTYALGGALVAADTITWTNFFPNGKFKLVSLRFWAPELDTDATPTGTIRFGDGTTADAYLTTTNIGLPAQAPANGAQIICMGNGASIGTSFTGLRNLVATIVGVMATSATTGTLHVEAVLEGL